MITACAERPDIADRRTTASALLLHDDPPPAAIRLPARAGSMPAPLAGLLSANGPEERQHVVAAMLRDVEHEWLVYGSLEPVDEGFRPVNLCTENADPQWARRYCAQRFHECDPRLVEAARSSLPWAWTLEDLQERAQASVPRSTLRHFVAELRATGMRSGVMFVLPGEPDRRRHVVSLLSRSPARRAMEGALLGQVLTLGLCLHEYYTRYSALPEAPDAPEPAATLTPVQREILGHVARGESDKRIAHHLRISSHAVDYHMRQLRHRFAVHNRVQLAQASRGIVG
jgi:DNA-binding CsgD family transcriptional regulator